MARKTIKYVATDGRDKGRTFLITEMPASQAEFWAYRTLLAVVSEAIEIPEEFSNAGMEGLAKLGIQVLSKLKWKDAEPLLKEMFDCVQVIPDPNKPSLIRPLIEEDIEEISTRVNIRSEIWNLHTSFLNADVN